MRGNIREEQQQLLGGSAAVVAAAAHELTTPLTLISYMAQMLGDEELSLNQADRAHYVRRLQVVSQRTLALVQHLTQYYRLEDQAQLAFAFAMEPVNMREVCESALHELTPYAKEYGQELQLAPMQRPPIAIANRNVMHDMMVNLVDVAIRHNQPGQAVSVRVAARDKNVRVAVHDAGSSVSKSELNKLWQNLGAAPRPLGGYSNTSGLGLYMVAQLARAMGGQLAVGNAQRGTTFLIDVMRSRQLSLL